MRVKHLLFLSFFGLFLPLSFQAQGTMSVSEGLSIRNDYGYEIVGRLRDRILLFRDKYDEFEVQAYDNQMHTAWNKTLDDLDRRGLQVLAVLGGKNDFSVIHRVRRRGTTQLRIHKYDPGATMIDSLTIKNYGERVFSPPVLEVLRSEDRNCFAVYNTAERDILEIVCFRVDKMQVLWDKKIELGDIAMTDIKAMTLSNDGEFFIVSEDNNRKGKAEGHALTVQSINPVGGFRQVPVPMPEILTHDFKFTYDNKNQQLLGAGLYADKNRERANGTFFLKILPGQTAPPEVYYTAFDDNFISILRRKDVEDDTKGIGDTDVELLIPRQDGGLLLIAERHHEIQRGAAGGRGFWRDGSRIVVDYYYEDMFVVAINPDGSTHWKTVLHKRQYSQDDDATFSSYFPFRRTDQLRFLFNDEIKYENTCSEYVLSPLGDFDRNSLLSTSGQNLRLRFRDALQLSGAECIVPSEFRNKLKLVLLRF